MWPNVYNNTPTSQYISVVHRVIIRLPHCKWGNLGTYDKIKHVNPLICYDGTKNKTVRLSYRISCNRFMKTSNGQRISINMMTPSNGNVFRVNGHLCGEFTGHQWIPPQRPVMRSFDVFFDLPLNKQLSKQSWGWWFETQSRSLWRHCNEGQNYSNHIQCLS